MTWIFANLESLLKPSSYEYKIYPFFTQKTAKDVKNWWREKVLKCIRDVIFVNQVITASGRYFNHWSIFGWAQVQWHELSLAKTGIVYMWNKNVYYQLQIFTVKLVCFTGTVKKEQLKSFASSTFFSNSKDQHLRPHVMYAIFFCVFYLLFCLIPDGSCCKGSFKFCCFCRFG